MLEAESHPLKKKKKTISFITLSRCDGPRAGENSLTKLIVGGRGKTVGTPPLEQGPRESGSGVLVFGHRLSSGGNDDGPGGEARGCR